MRTFPRALATLSLGSAIVLTGLAGPAIASTSERMTSNEKRVERAEKILDEAKDLKGTPYRYGANGPSAFDCASYVQYVYKKAGKKIGRTSGAQLAGKSIDKGDKRAGDILIFLRGGTAYHSAIYAGDGQMWEAQRTGVPVGKHDIWSSSYVVRRPSVG